jgi:AhpD family alkylhydroperoxidase
MLAKAGKNMPVLRAIKGGKAAPPKPSPVKPAVKPPPAAVADDVPVIALNLAPAKLSPAMAAYFRKCQDRLGFVPNVLLAYAFDMAKLETFVAMYNDLMLGDSGLSKLEREMIAVAVSSQNRCYYCLTAHGAAVRQYSGNPLLGGLALERRGRGPRAAAARRIYRPRHLGHLGGRRLLQHVEPRRISD